MKRFEYKIDGDASDILLIFTVWLAGLSLVMILANSYFAAAVFAVLTLIGAGLLARHERR